jgi:Flp pilus assembly protein TadD
MTTLWVSDEANPYREFRQRRPAEEIDRGVLVYSGDIELTAAAAVSRAFLSGDKLKEGNASEALLLAKDAQRLSPRNYLANWAVGDAESALGHSREARSAYQEALDELGTCDPVRAASSVKQLKQSMDMLKE